MIRLWPILVALFLDLVGFGMAFPDIQLRAEAMGASGLVIGLLQSALFAVQLIVSPRWGAWSDRIGRKPVLVICTVLSGLSMVAYALSTNLWGILLARVLGGFAAANVVAAQAYVADSTDAESRAAVLGKLSAAITGGIMVGPAIGGKISAWYGSSTLGWTAAAFSLFGALLLIVAVPHTRPRATDAPRAKLSILQWGLLREEAALKPLFALAAVAWFALACLEGTFGRLLAATYQYPVSALGITFDKPVAASGVIFSFESLLSIIVSAKLLPWIMRKLRPKPLLAFSYALQGVGLLLTPFAPVLGVIFIFSALYSVGQGIANPTVNAACSRLVSADRQGELFGLLQGARTVGFLVGPILGGRLFDIRPSAPYVLAGIVGLVAAVMVWPMKLPNELPASA